MFLLELLFKGVVLYFLSRDKNKYVTLVMKLFRLLLHERERENEFVEVAECVSSLVDYSIGWCVLETSVPKYPSHS